MAVKFYVDVHIPRSAVRELVRNRVDIVHCADLELTEADDQTHLNIATEQGRVLVTCDQDFEVLHYETLLSGRMHGGIVFLRGRDQCKNTSFAVKEILLLNLAADYERDLANQF